MALLEEVEQFIAASAKVRTPRELESLLEDISAALGFDHYALVQHVNLTGMNPALTHMSEEGLIALTNYPAAWAEFYVSRNLVDNDPTVLASGKSLVGFRWDDIPRLINVTSQHLEITEEARKGGIGEGFTIPAHVPGEANGSCSFAMRPGRPLPERNLHMAQLVGSFAFQAARSLVLNARAQAQPRQRKPLPQRQLECVLLYGRGKSEWEIGRILGISQETVRKHLREARRHYDVVNSRQAVAHAVLDGHFSVIDLVRR